MTIEVTQKAVSARELRDLLNATPEYLLDAVPVTIYHEESNMMFEMNHVEIYDMIEDGARVQMVRISGEGVV